MAVNVNLLPTDLAANKGVAKIADVLTKLSMAGAALFVVFSAFGIALNIILTSQLRAEKQKEESLKASIASLELVEQKFVLVRDRLKKSSAIIKDRKVEPSVDKLQNMASSLPSGVLLYDAEVTANRSKLTFAANDSLALATFLSQLVANKDYKEVVLKSFSFNPSSGYLVLLEVQ